MISLKTVFNFIKFANELTNKVSFMFHRFYHSQIGINQWSAYIKLYE